MSGEIRENYELPALVGGEIETLPDYYVLRYEGDGVEYVVELHPDRILMYVEQLTELHDKILFRA